MKLSTKIILPIILISALLILLAGCTGVSDDSPGYTPGSIIGIIMVPEDCSDCLTDGNCLPPKSISGDIPSHWVPAEEAIVTVIPHATITDEDGYYTLTDVEPGVYYVITATYKNLVLKDVVEPDGVEAGKIYDAGTANCESTALGLYVEYLWDMGLDAEEIELLVETYIETDEFAELVDTVCCIIEDCDNVTNYCCLVECDEPEFTCSTTSLNISITTPDCDETCTTIGKPITVKFIGKDDVVINNFSDSRLIWDIPSGIDFTESTGEVCLTDTVVGTYNIKVTYVDPMPDLCGSISKTIPVTFSECECPPPTSLDIDISTPACDEECATISKVTVHFTGRDDLVITNFDAVDSPLSWTPSTGIDFTESSGEVCLTGDVGTFNLEVTYTDPDECGSVSKTIPVTFSECECGSCYQSDSDGCYTIESSATYDGTNTTFWFKICNTSTGPSCDISHWVYGTSTEAAFCIDSEDIVSITPAPQSIDSDGSTGYYGIKWDMGAYFGVVECKEFSVVLSGCRVGEINNYKAIIKDGSGYDTVLDVCGPTCD